MRISRLNTENNSTFGKIKELTIYRVLKNQNTINANNNKNNIYINKNINQDNINNIDQDNTDNNVQNQNNSYNQSPIQYTKKSPHTPDIPEDDYILELHKKLEEKRELRKISEQNVKILNGRVRCLKDENKKICAKIDITKKKTKEKELAINNHRSRSKEKQDLKEKRQSDIKLLKLKNQYQKLVNQTNLINTRENMFIKNKIKGQISKAQKVDNENLKKENELNYKLINQNKTEIIRSQMNNNKKKKIAEIKKKEELIKNLEEKINVENIKKKELDEEMKKLNIMENEILGKVKANNEMQRKLIENFEKNFGQGLEINQNNILMSLNNINNSCLNSMNGLEQFYDEYENNYE